MRLRPTGVTVAAALALAAPAAATGTNPAPVLSSHGIGDVRIGVAKARAVAELASLLGPPSRRFASDGCGPRYTEVEWGHLYVEFRLGRLTGFRYMRGSWQGRNVAPGAAQHTTLPQLATTEGISLGSTLGRARVRYRALELIGTDRWRSRDGLVFSISFATTQPAPATSRITEIKYGTCGDW